MKSTALVCALAAAALGFGTLAGAQGWDRGQDRDGRHGGWTQGRGGQQQEPRQWQGGRQQQRQAPVPVQVRPEQPRQVPPQGQWGQQRRGRGPAQDSAPPSQGPPPRYGIPPQGYVQQAPPPQVHYGPPGAPHGYGQGQPQWQNQQRQDPQWQNPQRADVHGAERGAWRQAPRFRRGDYLPPEYRQRYVQDWRAHRLYAPPPGFQWVQVDTGDYLLIAIGSGVIANLLLGQ